MSDENEHKQEKSQQRPPPVHPQPISYYPPQTPTPQQPPQQPIQPNQAQPYQYPAQPFPQHQDPQIAKARLLMEKDLKGGMGKGVGGAIGGAVVYIVLPLFIVYCLFPMIAPADQSDIPDVITDLLDGLTFIALYIGWFMVVSGFVHGYYKKGTPRRMLGGLGKLGGKAAAIYILFSPFVLSVTVGDEGGFSLDYVRYFRIIYILILLTCVYIIAEFAVYRKDYRVWKDGGVTEEYLEKAGPAQQPAPVVTAPPPQPAYAPQAPPPQFYPPPPPPAPQYSPPEHTPQTPPAPRDEKRDEQTEEKEGEKTEDKDLESSESGGREERGGGEETEEEIPEF